MALCAVVEVLFDIDAGHEVQHVYPAGTLAVEELSDVAFSAFPDSMSKELHGGTSVRDSSFSFRVRRRPPPPGTPILPHAFLYGHAFCRQRQDGRLRRGCEQKSIVLLSYLPLFGMLEPLARLVGPTALNYGPGALREVFQEVQRWPPLEWGCRMALPLFGMEAVSVELPLLASLPGSALPAAVGAALGLHLPPAAAQDAGQPAANSGSDGESGGSGEPGGRGGAPDAGSSGAGEVADDAGGKARDRVIIDDETGGDVDSASVAASRLAAASPAQVAAALADELDGCDGLPLCLMPQAYGRQELAASPFGDCDCFTPLRGVLAQLWGLWELLLLGEPLMVVAPSPGACSAAVAALLSLLAPFPYSLDFRPYFTIHDPAFARLATGTLPTPANGLPLVLGITNMYFLKALPEWPNVLATGHTAATLLPSSSGNRLEESAGGGGSNGSMHPSESGASEGSSGGSSFGGGSGSSSRPASTSRLGGILRRRPATPAVLLSEPLDHCWMGYKPLTQPDKQLMQRLMQPEQSDSADKWQRLAAVNSGMLRRHFQDLTKALLMPLLPYFTPTLPPSSSGHASDLRVAPPEPPPLPWFDVPALLLRLGHKDCVPAQVLLERFGSRRGLLHFYERFLSSPNLVAFVHLRRLAAEEWQRQEWAEAATVVRAPMKELMTVESFFLMEQQLAQARQQLADGGGGKQGTSDDGGTSGEGDAASLVEQLQQKLHLAFSELPEDLQQAILQTPSHAALLGQQQAEQRQQQAQQVA